jgi:hypothetical protein
MPRSAKRRATPISGQRVFADDDGRLWNATFSAAGGGAVEFSCISDARRSVRAIALDLTLTMAEITDDTLRGWLRTAPPLGRLT